MAAKSTTKTGSWSDPSVWGGAVPVSGDTVTINTGHAQVWDQSFSGIAGMTINANVTTSGTGLTFGFAAGAAITQGSGVANVSVTIGAGNAIAGVNGTPAVWTIGHVYAPGTGMVLVLAGSTGSHCAASDVRFTWDGTNGGGGTVRATFADFTRCGDATHAAISFYQVGYANPFQLYDCTFNACGSVANTSDVNGVDVFDVQRCVWSNTASGVFPVYITCVSAKTTGTRNLIGCTLDGPLKCVGVRDWTFSGNVFWLSIQVVGSAPWASFDGNLIRKPDPGSNNVLAMIGNFSNTYLLCDGTLGNPHHFTISSSLSGTFTIDGIIYESTNNPGPGEFLVTGGVAGPTTLKLTRLIGLPNATGGPSGNLLNMAADANLTVSVEHCTLYTGSGGGLWIGETYPGHAGMVSSYRANLIWDTTGRANGNYQILDTGHTASGSGIVTDLVAPSAADYNGSFHGSATYPSATWYTNQGNGYAAAFSATPGAHDVIGVDPQFVDPNRKAATWDVALGGDGTPAHILAQFQARNASYTVAALITYVRAGFTPQASAYKNASYPGDPLLADIGALAVVVAGGGGSGGSAHFVPGAIAVTATEATGGTSPYGHQWQRSTVGGGSGFGNLTNGAGVSGATTLGLSDGSALTGTLYYYRLQYTDANLTVTYSNEVAAQVYPGGALASGLGVRLLTLGGGF